MNTIDLCERGWVPDTLTRWGVRRLCQERLTTEYARGAKDAGKRTSSPLDRWKDADSRLSAHIDRWRDSPIAHSVSDANTQHYEVPTPFYLHALGPRLKYSCGLWESETSTLADSENASLRISCERAGISNGMKVLDLGCGWGSLTLWLAEQYQNLQITSVSNSRTQADHIRAQAAARGYENIEVITADINEFQPTQRFDRIMSIEMFEHVRNHGLLLSHIQRWLEPEGALFVHIFCHTDLVWAYEDDGDKDWMARHFFTGGIMPSWDLLTRFPESMSLDTRWWISGNHYQKTSEAWLARTDAHREELLKVFTATYGKKEGAIQLQRWRMFFIAVAEFFGYNGGNEWGVGHFLLKPTK